MRLPIFRVNIGTSTTSRVLYLKGLKPCTILLIEIVELGSSNNEFILKVIVPYPKHCLRNFVHQKPPHGWMLRIEYCDGQITHQSRIDKEYEIDVE